MLTDLIENEIDELSSEETNEAEKEIYKEDLFMLATDLLSYEEVNWPTHGPIIEVLESSKRRKLIVAPRGSFKSSLCIVAYAIRCLLRENNARILIDSELYTNSRNFLREIKAHLTSDRMVNLFGDFRSDPWTEREIVISQRTDKTLKEASITVSGIGAVKVSQHYTHILCDDYNSHKNSKTKEGRQKVIDHYKYNVSLLEPDGELVLVGTRYAEDDCIGWVLNNEIKPEKEAEDAGL